MKRSLTLIWILFLSSCFTELVAQTQFNNGGMEQWQLFANGLYEEPTGGWATANFVGTLGPAAPITTFKETQNVHSGCCAAKMVSGQFNLLGGLSVAGTLAYGKFVPDLGNFTNSLKLGQPFTERPARLQGYYSYFPEGEDSADLYVQLTRWVNGQREIIGFGGIREYDEVPTYTFFDVSIDYSSSATPDSLAAVFVSSAGGQEFAAVEGSTLFIDDLVLLYPNGIKIPMMSEVGVQISPNPTSDLMRIQLATPLQQPEIRLYNLAGQLLHQQTLNGSDEIINVRQLPAGMVFYQLYHNNSLVAGGRFEILR